MLCEPSPLTARSPAAKAPIRGDDAVLGTHIRRDEGANEGRGHDEVVAELVELEVAVPDLSPAVR